MSKSISIRDRIGRYYDGSSAYSGAKARQMLCSLQIDPASAANFCVNVGNALQLLFGKNEQNQPQVAGPEIHNG